MEQAQPDPAFVAPRPTRRRSRRIPTGTGDDTGRSGKAANHDGDAHPQNEDGNVEPTTTADGPAQGFNFVNDSAAAWATVDIDDTVREAFAMDPRERAARRARLRGEDPFQFLTTDNSTPHGGYRAPRIASAERFQELASDEDH